MDISGGGGGGGGGGDGSTGRTEEEGRLLALAAALLELVHSVEAAMAAEVAGGAAFSVWGEEEGKGGGVQGPGAAAPSIATRLSSFPLHPYIRQRHPSRRQATHGFVWGGGQGGQQQSQQQQPQQPVPAPVPFPSSSLTAAGGDAAAGSSTGPPWSPQPAPWAHAQQQQQHPSTITSTSASSSPFPSPPRPYRMTNNTTTAERYLPPYPLSLTPPSLTDLLPPSALLQRAAGEEEEGEEGSDAMERSAGSGCGGGGYGGGSTSRAAMAGARLQGQQQQQQPWAVPAKAVALGGDFLLCEVCECVWCMSDGQIGLAHFRFHDTNRPTQTTTTPTGLLLHPERHGGRRPSPGAAGAGERGLPFRGAPGAVSDICLV